MLFLDLVGFSIIFPLFPDILEHYLAHDGADGILGKLVAHLTEMTGAESQVDWRVMTLFGGILGSLYSLLQFLFSPIWGSLSDRHGRRPILLLTIAGTTVSYLIWILSGSFLLLLVSRAIGGIMSGNIATATAAMADSTTKANRAKGMGIIGAAFGLGFIFGPAIGGLCSLVDLSEKFPDLTGIGLNPFSMAGVVAFVLSLANLVWAYRRFGETHPPERRGQTPQERSLNPLRMFAGAGDARVQRTNLAYFVFLVAFSGMEFTLTFLVKDRLQFEPMDIMKMFVFVGLVVAFVQGGVVRRIVPRLGEQRVASIGLVLISPGLVILARAQSPAALYAGLAFMGVGSALAIPSLTSLVSLLSPVESQGKAIGLFRSAGALARAVGPLAAAYLYYRFDSAPPYYGAAALLIIPLVLVLTVPQPEKQT